MPKKGKRVTHYYQDEEAALPYLEAALRKQIAAEQGASAANDLLGFI